MYNCIIMLKCTICRIYNHNETKLIEIKLKKKKNETN